MLTEVLVVILISSATAKSGLPVFDTTYEEVNLIEGYVEAIWCNASGDTPMAYDWHDQNNDQIHNGSDAVSVLYTPSGSSLIFNVTEPYHNGLYTCSAENRHGRVSKIYSVFVNSEGNRTEDDKVEILHVDIDNVTDSSVTFFMHASGNPQLYIVRYIEKMENISRTVDIPAAELIEITGLIPSGSYKFEFKGQSALHVSEDWSTFYQVVLLPDAPEMILRSLGGGTLKINWFRKFHDVMRGTWEGQKLSYATVSMMRGNDWDYRDCVTEIFIPFCSSTTYTVAGLDNRVHYEIQLATRTKAGYGKPNRFKIYLE